MANTTKSPGTIAEDSSIGGESWGINITNITASDNLYATVSLGTEGGPSI